MSNEITNVEPTDGVKGVFFSFATDDSNNFILQVNVMMSLNWAAQLAQGILDAVQEIKRKASGIVIAPASTANKFKK